MSPGPSGPPTRPAEAGLRIAFVNVRYGNRKLVQLLEALHRAAPDVVAFSEASANLDAAIEASALGAQLGHRVGPAGRGLDQVVLRSRLPLHGVRLVERDGVVAIETDIDVGDRVLAVAAVQLPPMFASRPRTWRRAHRAVSDLVGTNEGAALVLGDFNAMAWQAPMRALGDRGWRHIDFADAAGAAGTARSWPAPVPIVGIDHAFARGDVSTRACRVIHAPGSDHRGLLLDVVVGPTPGVIDRAGDQPRGVKVEAGPA
jgi:endonuclease/exonuclease/phosphatase (EEP) superfamily protein YafD